MKILLALLFFRFSFLLFFFPFFPTRVRAAYSACIPPPAQRCDDLSGFSVLHSVYGGGGFRRATIIFPSIISALLRIRYTYVGSFRARVCLCVCVFLCSCMRFFSLSYNFRLISENRCCLTSDVCVCVGARDCSLVFIRYIIIFMIPVTTTGYLASFPGLFLHSWKTHITRFAERRRARDDRPRYDI